MPVLIGHSSIDEKGNIAGGKAGDQTKREVCTRAYYNMGYNVVLRPKKNSIAKASVKACKQGCANNHIGYDQYQRNTLYTQASKVGFDLSKVKVDCETDCSAFMTVCAIAGGVSALKYSGNAPTTSTMRRAFVNSGAYKALTDSKYLTSDKYLKAGDICVKEGSHTFMILENGSAIKGNSGAVSTSTKNKGKYYNKYTGNSKSFSDALSSMGIDGSRDHRKKIAIKNGIKNYEGSTAQNTKLFNLLKKGKLLKA